MGEQALALLALLVLGTALVHPATRLMRAWTRVIFSLLLDDSATSEDVEPSLGLRYDLPVLVFLETDVFLPDILMLFWFVDRLRVVGGLLEALCVDETHHFLPALSG